MTVLVRVFGCLALGALLAGCGVDGDPQPPLRADGTQPSPVSIQGEARVGVSGSF
ncbi:hypothetical protein [Paenirhodobacter enshiensis]|uniref:hypothetical protein n=1 Tax=Paenirhodobacter enshiensis TaxID=1105367 RepID=UPI00146FE03F|nr:hypothetical protein [Paenirhodobacter enshiensis]